MTIASLKPVRVAIDDDREGRLVFLDDVLVALLVQLSDMHGDRRGAWFLEAGFGDLHSANPPVFRDLDTASAWATARVQISPRRPV